MPSHQERVRRNYTCPDCVGTGIIDDYEGQYPCSDCNGSGIVLTARTPRTGGPLPICAELVYREALAVMKNHLAVASALVKQV